jgi:hypothetical protein
MDSKIDTKFKLHAKIRYNYIWTTVYSLTAISFLYQEIIQLYDKGIDLPMTVGLIAFLLLVWIFVPMSFSILIGKPAIALTDEYLINNYNGFTIKWEDISEIHMTEGMRNSGIAINLKQPDVYFNSLIRKIRYTIRQTFTSSDMIIAGMFLSGDTDKNFSLIYTFWE